MFHFTLFDDRRLIGKTVSEKRRIINLALNLSREKNPLNRAQRLFLIVALALLPAAAIFYLVSFSWAVCWSVVMIFVLNLRFAAIESPLVEPFLDEAIRLADSQI